MKLSNINGLYGLLAAIIGAAGLVLASVGAAHPVFAIIGFLLMVILIMGLDSCFCETARFVPGSSPAPGQPLALPLAGGRIWPAALGRRAP